MVAVADQEYESNPLTNTLRTAGPCPAVFVAKGEHCANCGSPATDVSGARSPRSPYLQRPGVHYPFTPSAMKLRFRKNFSTSRVLRRWKAGCIIKLWPPRS